MGRGQASAPVNIGIEHKTVGDLVSSVSTGRLQGHQLPGMRADDGGRPRYDFSWLVIEGALIYDRNGVLQRKGSKGQHRPLGMTVTELHKRLLTMHVCGGLNPIWLPDRSATVQWISAFYHFWTDQDLDKHKSHLAIYQAPALVPLSTFRRTISTLPGVGHRVSRTAEKQFKTIRRAVNASVTEWAALETMTDKGVPRKFGASRASKLVEGVTT